MRGRVIRWGMPRDARKALDAGYFFGGAAVQPDCVTAYDRGCLACRHMWHSAHALKQIEKYMGWHGGAHY